MNNRLYLQVNNISVKITCAKKVLDIFFKNKLLLSSVIPMANLIVSNKKEHHDFSITIQSGEMPTISIEEDRLFFSDSEDSFDISSFAYTILTPVISTLLLRKDQLFIHGAVVAKNEKGFILTGNGKTSTAFSLCRDCGYKLVAEDNSILNLLNYKVMSNCQSINIDHRLAKKTLNCKSRIAPEELGIFIKNTCQVDKIFFLTSCYDRSDISKITGYEKSSVVCTLVNERLLNYSRWNNRLNQQPPILLNINDIEKKNKIINTLMERIPVYKVASTINNNHILIKDHLHI